MARYSFTAKLWRSPGKGGWHFVTLPQDVAVNIRFLTPSARGFVPIACEATINGSTWRTSVFPDSKSGSYLLAVKADIRKRAGIGADDDLEVIVRIAE